MKKCRFFAAILLLVLMAAMLCPAAMAVEPPAVHAEAALLMDAKYDQVLFEKNADEPREPASLTKVMTAMLVLEAVDAGQLSMGQEITVKSAYHEGSYYGFKAGDKLRVEDLLYCMMVSSANDAASILAQTVGGDEETFVARMNAKAAELGCTNTNFVNPHGIPVEGHYSTARDMYLIARKAMEHETFRTIVGTKRYTMPAIQGVDENGAATESKPQTIYNTNALLEHWRYGPDYLYSKAIGIKTGTASGDNYCLLSAAEDEEQYLICVVLAVHHEQGEPYHQFSDSRTLFEWGFDNFSRKQLVDTAKPCAEVKVTLSGEDDHVLVRPETQLERTLPNDMDKNKITMTVRLDSDTVEAPVEEGQPLGKLVLAYEGEELGTINLVAVKSVGRSALLYRLNQVKNFFSHPIMRIVAALAVIVIVVLVLRRLLMPNSRRRNRYGSKRYSGRRNYRGRRR